MGLEVGHLVQRLAGQDNPYCTRTTTCAVLLVATARCGARAVIGLPFNGGNLISTPAILAVRQCHDIFLEFDADQLTVARRLELVGAMILERCWCGKTSHTGHGTSGQGDGRSLDGILDDGRGGRDCVIGGSGEQDRRHCEDGSESNVNHGGGDGRRDLPANGDPSTYVWSARCTPHARLCWAGGGSANDEREARMDMC